MIQELYISHIAGVPLKEARSAETNQETLGLIGSCHLTHSVSSRGQADKVINGSNSGSMPPNRRRCPRLSSIYKMYQKDKDKQKHCLIKLVYKK